MSKVEIVPIEEELKIESNGSVCTVEGCGKLFQASSQLHMHVTKHHQGKQLSSRTRSYLFYCPVEGCERSKSGRKPFPRLGQLKQHYQRIHGNKVHSCQNCGKSFSLRDEYSRHLSECGKTFSCQSCGEGFKTRNALYKHAQRKKHSLPEGSKPRGRRKGIATSIPLDKEPVIIKQVVRLSDVVSSGTQTDPADLKDGRPSDGLNPAFEEIDHRDTSNCIDIHPNIFLDFSTQTEQSPCLNNSFDISNLATQTDFQEFLNFGTQTSCHTSSQSSQTLHSQTTPSTPTLSQPEFFGTHTSNQSCQTQHYHLIPPSQTQVLNFGTQTASQSSQTQQNYAVTTPSPPSNQAEFGTQTTSYQLLGIATQTSSNDLYCPLNPLESRTDFGTQTIDFFSDVVPFLPPECLDLGTQTTSTTSLEFCMQAHMSDEESHD